MRWAVAVGIDGVMVLAFAAIGRSSHSENDTLIGVLGTAWPYLIATVVGSLIARVMMSGSGRVTGERTAPYGWGSGLIVWVTTVVLGMLLRLLSGDTAAWPFWIVAFITLGILLLGWRLIARAVLRRARFRTPEGS